MPTMDFWFEFGSTYTYPTVMRIEELAARAGVNIQWKVFLLGAIFNRQGWDDSPFNIYPAKGKYMWRDMERICEGLSLPFQLPSRFPRNGLLASRVACMNAGAGWLPAFVRSVFQANFAADQEISEPAVLLNILAELGLDGAAILEEAQSPTGKARLRAQTDEAIALDIFGAPTFLVAGEMFWGNDRLEDALAWAVSKSGTAKANVVA